MFTAKNACRIVLTGGPGAGKTTAADLLRREIGDSVVIVPEAATLLFEGGFPRYKTEFAQMATQETIYSIQKNLENVQTANYPDRILLCDRGTLDSAVYWPKGAEDFFKEIGSSLEREYKRYDAVIFFETAAVGGISIEGGNLFRTESLKEAVELDQLLKKVWEKHPNFHFIPHESSFLKKMIKALDLIQDIVQKHHL